MRVLERRTPLPESDLSLPQPRSYSVSPARPSRAEVVVKRAQPPTRNVHTRPEAAGHPARTSDVRRGRSARRVRGLSLLASLALVVVVPTPYFAVTDAAGRFEIRGVPPGNYKAVVFHEKKDGLELDVTIGPGAKQTLDLLVER